MVHFYVLSMKPNLDEPSSMCQTYGVVSEIAEILLTDWHV